MSEQEIAPTSPSTTTQHVAQVEGLQTDVSYLSQHPNAITNPVKAEAVGHMVKESEEKVVVAARNLLNRATVSGQGSHAGDDLIDFSTTKLIAERKKADDNIAVAEKAYDDAHAAKQGKVPNN